MASSIYDSLNLGTTKTVPLSEQTSAPWDFTTTNEGKPSNELDKDSFLKLFIAQLKNQDPLSPMDGSDFVAQLATFSQLEQLYTANESLTKIASYLSSLNAAESLNLLNKTVTVVGKLLTVKDGSATPFAYILPEDAGDVTIKVKDVNGSTVRTLELGSQAEGYHTSTWDGKDSSGNLVSDGAYTFEVVANTKTGYPMEVTSICTGQVTGMRFDDTGAPQLLVGQEITGLTDKNGDPLDTRILVPLSDVIQVMPTSSTALSTETLTQLLSGLSGGSKKS